MFSPLVHHFCTNRIRSALVSPTQFNGYDSELFLVSIPLASPGYFITLTRFMPHVNHSSRSGRSLMKIHYHLYMPSIPLGSGPEERRVKSTSLPVCPPTTSNRPGSISSVHYPSYYFFPHSICVSCIRCIFRKGSIFFFPLPQIMFYLLFHLSCICSNL